MDRRNIGEYFLTPPHLRHLSNKNSRGMDRTNIPPHLRHLSDKNLRGLFYLFRAR